MKKILCILMIICILTIAVLPSASAAGVVLSDNKMPIVPDVIGDGSKKWEKEFCECYGLDPSFGYFYSPLYEYYDDVSGENLVPEYVLVYFGWLEVLPVQTFAYYGNYLVISGGFAPYLLGYMVYLPKENKIINLRKAYDSGIEGIESIFTDYGLGELSGDMNKDGKLTVCDATYIQKCLVGLESFSNNDEFRGLPEEERYGNYIYRSDFNRDGVRNIKDATAIQKHIAGITE